MAKKIFSWKPKGMNMDTSPSSMTPDFVYENKNLRLITNEHNTALSWTTEKGTSTVTLVVSSTNETNIMGTPIGVENIADTLVIFTTATDGYDRIYISTKLTTQDYTNATSAKQTKGTLRLTRLFKGHLNFSVKHPLDTLPYYESENIQKVYWVDGINQARVINIAEKDTNKLTMWNNWGSEVCTCFDFVPSFTYRVNNSFTRFKIEKNTAGGGSFLSGVIQYCFTYSYKNGQQTNIIYTSPLYYLSHSDRGAKPNDQISCSFNINITNIDNKFDYLNIYSIFRSAIDTTPEVKLLDVVDLSTNAAINYVDTGYNGTNVDPFELLYIGGKEVIPYALAEKDNTLFLGNLTQVNNNISAIQKYFRKYYEDYGDLVRFKYGKTITNSITSDFYSYDNTLVNSQDDITTFKGGETYRFGFQLQKKTGEWTEPIWIGDYTNTLYPKTSLYSKEIQLATARAYITSNSAAGVDTSIYQKIRPVIVYPNLGDRNILCQGVLNPTVFNIYDRKLNAPFAQASWYYRPYMAGDASSTEEDPSDEPKVNVLEYMTFTLANSIPDDNQMETTNYFTDYDLYDKVCILIADINPTNPDNPERTGKIYIYSVDEYEDYTDSRGTFNRTEYLNIPYDCAISMGVGDGDRQRYAFIFKSEVLTKEYYNEVKNTSGYSKQGYLYQNCDYVATNGKMDFRWYKDIQFQNGIPYYMAPTSPEGAPEVCWFEFYIENKDIDYKIYARLTLQSVGDKITNIYSSSSAANKGTGIAYSHYKPIYSQDTVLTEIINKNTESTTKLTNEEKEQMYSKIEIQGSYDSVSDAYWTNNDTQNNSTEFMVDQSIVTLNSPDIEFDSSIQAYQSNNVGLRIIGVIPITATASSYSISAGAMLNLGYNDSSSSYEDVFGTGIKPNKNVLYTNINKNGGKRLCAAALWNDVLMYKTSNSEKPVKASTLTDYIIFPWQRNGSLTNDNRGKENAGSWLNEKKESNLLFSLNTEYFPEKEVYYTKLSEQTVYTENAEVFTTRLKKQRTFTSDINYYANIDKVLLSGKNYRCLNLHSEGLSDSNGSYALPNSPISMKYKSTSHVVIALQEETESSGVPILPYAIDNGTYGQFSYDEDSKYPKTFWGDNMSIDGSKSIDLSDNFMVAGAHQHHNVLWLGELYKTTNSEFKFGGTSDNALKNNDWIVAGSEVVLNNGTYIEWTIGDTYFQRYDSLKTYAYTQEDQNQLVEILSFMCETHVNIDGRYDRNRGQIENTTMSPTNFNLLNTVYSQKNNFFQQKKTNADVFTSTKYPNLVYYSKTKTDGEDTDAWTNVTLSSILSMNGDSGAINKLVNYNGQIICFQDTGISQILYNENTQVSTTAGVPIEIANSGKVQGKRYITDSVGCKNKWSICKTPSGLFFVDDDNRDIYTFSDGIKNISANGVNTWCKANINKIGTTDVKWNPSFGNNMVTYYDPTNNEVFFINKDTALAYSLKTQTFTSFYDYGNIPYFTSLQGHGLWITQDSTIHLHQGGDYNMFFGTAKPYSMTLVCNPSDNKESIFTNLEFRATVGGDGIMGATDTHHTIPFDTIEAWNEYQHGISTLKTSKGLEIFKHNTSDKNAALIKKFRLWRCDIPRDNAPVSTTSDYNKGIFRTKARPLDRMRNPWLYIKLEKQPYSGSLKGNTNVSYFTEIHDILGIYY